MHYRLYSSQEKERALNHRRLMHFVLLMAMTLLLSPVVHAGSAGLLGATLQLGPIPLPTRRSVYTVLRSPHVNKKSREQFEIRIHKRLIDLTHTTQQTIDDLTKLVLPAGVDIEIKT